MTRLTVEFEWQPVGRVTLDSAGRLVFPGLPSKPGLYRFWIEGGDDRPEVYIGEASDLRRRAQHYRTPGPSQTTNVRLNELLKSAVSDGRVVSVMIVTEVTMALDDALPRDLPLDRRSARLIAEQAAITTVSVDMDGGAPVYARVLDRPGVGEAEYE
jgi:hypothetical protein